MTWLTLKSNDTVWHVNMENVETVKVWYYEGLPKDSEPKIESIGFFFKNDLDPSLYFTDEEEELEPLNKAIQDFMNKHKKS